MAAAGFFAGTHRRPTWRRKCVDEGFCIRDSRVRIVNRKWAQALMSKLGLVKFRLSRQLPAGKLGMARVTCRAGRWHVSFPAPQPAVLPSLGREERMVGIDRGVATTLALSDGTMLRAPIMRCGEHKRLVPLPVALPTQVLRVSDHRIGEATTSIYVLVFNCSIAAGALVGRFGIDTGGPTVPVLIGALFSR